MNKENRISIGLLLLTFILSLPFIFQGLDFTDMGFWLTSYQQFYTHPDTIWTACWLSSFIGHWVGFLFGGSILSYKIGYVLVITASAMISFLLLGSQIGRGRMLAALILVTVFFTRGYGGNWIGYNELTAFLYLISVALLFFGLIGHKKLLVVLAGIVLGANIYIRLPNIVGISLISAVWFYGWASRWSLREVLVCSLALIGGFALGAALIWGLIVINGHDQIYIQGIRAIVNEASSASSPHSGGILLKQLVRDHVSAFSKALILLFIFGCFSYCYKYKKTLTICILCFMMLLFIFCILYFRGYFAIISPNVLYAVLIGIIGIIITNQSESSESINLSLLAFISGLILFITPLGSANGLGNCVFSMWLALPLTLTWLWHKADASIPLLSMTVGKSEKCQCLIACCTYRLLAATMILALLFQSVASVWRHTYLDNVNRFAMTDSIKHPLLIGTFTTPDRAKVVTELLDAMSQYTKPDDEVLAYNGIPLVYFLTKTHPWLGISWPDFESYEKISKLVQKKEQSGARLPNVVRAIGSIYDKTWPKPVQPLATWWHQDEPRRVFSEFEKRHGYVVTWSNGFFEILIPIPGKQSNENRR